MEPDKKPPAKSVGDVKTDIRKKIESAMRGPKYRMEFKVVPHTVLPNCQCVELWLDGKMMGTIVPHDQPGVRLITKHLLAVDLAPGPIQAVEILLNMADHPKNN